MNALPIMNSALRDVIADATAKIDTLDPQWVEIPTLLPADALLDLYGEDIRERAFIIHDPVDGDMILRPDFTLPVVQSHFASGAGTGRYAYSGRVWRKRRETNRSDRSFWQLGFEQFAEAPSANADAEVFTLASQIARPFGLRPVLGDLGLIFSALDQIEMADFRRRALKRHVWRPRAFARLLAHYSRPISEKAPRAGLIDAPIVGLRNRAMIEARLERLTNEANAEPLPSAAVDLLDALVSMNGSLASVAVDAHQLAKDYGVGREMADALQSRADAFADRGNDPSQLAFDAGFGRTSMEYYDGMVFGWFREGFAAPVISGGRYDGLTHVAGGSPLAAVGVAVRPELLVGL